MYGEGWKATVEATLRIVPRRSRSDGTKSRVSSVSATMLTCSISPRCTGASVSNGP
jgi:hypothetical protein